MKYKFSVGDYVRVIKQGYGVTNKEIRKVVQITARGLYFEDVPGYKVIPLIGNSKTGSFDGFIGEPSFKRDIRTQLLSALKIKTHA